MADSLQQRLFELLSRKRSFGSGTFSRVNLDLGWEKVPVW